MPVFQIPSIRDGVDGQVLDLDTAVKDGVLGGGAVAFGGGGSDKLDLKKMIEELNLPENQIPSVFICPISLDPMEDPVTLCTGQTYDRPNILKWFNFGHFTCPTTMQELWDHSLTPNNTLQKLIYTWFSQMHFKMKKKSLDIHGTICEILDTLQTVKGQARVTSLKTLNRLVTTHVIARETVVNRGVSLLLSLLGPYTSHAIGSKVISILVRLNLDNLDSSSRLNLTEPANISLLVDMLNEGSIETKINCTLLIKRLTEESEFQVESVSSHGLLVGLIRLVKDKRHPSGILHGLSLMKSISSHNQVKTLMVNTGAIAQLVELVPTFKHECLEQALYVLDDLSTVPEGTRALSECCNTIPHMVRVLMRVSEKCTQHALSILWSICRVSPNECSLMAVDVGLAAKLLLVIQSACDPLLKQQSAELLKLCSLHCSDSVFFSKCKITRTIR